MLCEYIKKAISSIRSVPFQGNLMILCQTVNVDSDVAWQQCPLSYSFEAKGVTAGESSQREK